MKILDLAKGALSLVISFGVGTIVGNLIKHTTPVDVGKLTGYAIKIGALVLSGVAGDAASKYAEDQIDNTIETVTNTLNGIMPEEEEVEAHE